MVDSNDRERIHEARDELARMTNEDELRGVPVLIFANKQDLPNAMSVAEVVEALNLNQQLRGRAWYCQACCAPAGDGLYEGMDWISSQVE